MCSADAVKVGVEDKFYYSITDDCVACGACSGECPVNAVSLQEDKYEINPELCIDCGTCSSVCPVGAAQRIPYIRESISIQDIDMDKCYFNPGCAMNLYKPDAAEQMFIMLQEQFGDIKSHTICCRHDPMLEEGSTIINNCAGCDRRFRSLYQGVNTISVWEILDSIGGLKLPDHSGLTVSVHDSCGYRHKPQVHSAIRSLLAKMNIEIIESEFSGTESVCCGDNYYGIVPNEAVEERIRMRAGQLPCQDVVVYCIGCVRALGQAGKKAHYLPDLILGRHTEPMKDTLDEYHGSLVDYIEKH